MAEETPLLPLATRPTHEHAIFLRVCHSPWTFIGQKALTLFRGLFLAYVTAVFFTTLDFDVHHDGRGKFFAFYAGHISIGLQIVYYSITTFWAAQHIQFPRNRPHSIDNSSTSVRNRLRNRAMSLFSIPRSNEYGEGRRFAFSIFYTASTVFPFVVTFAYWMKLLGGHHTHGFKDDRFTQWLELSLYGVNSIIAFLEIVLLSSVRKITPFAGHCIALVCIVVVYCFWIGLCYGITGTWLYPQLDPQIENWQEIVTTITTMMSITLAVFLIVIVLHELRDRCARKAKCDRQG